MAVRTLAQPPGSRVTGRSGLLNYRCLRRLPVIRQTEIAECGLACLAMIAGYHGHETDLTRLRHRFPVSLKGSTLASLVEIAARLDLAARPLKVTLGSLHRLRTPCVLHWNLNHFVVLKKARRNRCTVIDPALGERRYSLSEVSARFTGIALELEPTTDFKRRIERAPMKLADLWGNAAGLTRALLQTLALSLIVQLFVLVAPFYMQLVVDEVLTRFDSDLLPALAVGFGTFMLINVAASALRAHVILYISSSLGLQMVTNLFRHLLRLPLAWFEQRHVGDVLSRFSSTSPIRELLAEGLVASIIDGLMTISTLIVIFVYSPRLGAIVITALSIYLSLRLGLFSQFRRHNEDSLVLAAREQSTFIETVRGIQSIKLLGQESQRSAQWQNRCADAINADIRIGRLRIGFDTANGLLFGVENTLVVYFGALLVIDGAMTIGMLFAFMSYKAQFTDKAGKLVDRLIEFRLLSLHLSRIADIALAEPETVNGSAGGQLEAVSEPRRVGHHLALRKVSFRYGAADPWILKDSTLHVAAGEMIVIAGPSGCGKTTLLKILLGLFEPVAGEVLVHGRPLKRHGNAGFRKRIGTVMQDDALFAGSIADNISGFDPDPDTDKLRRCADVASIHADISAMPMGYHSLVGEMGSVLSAGQRQRVLLARALYREPEILLLDEGTANLDAKTEAAVVNAVRGMNVTRICVAHGGAMIRAADRVYVLWNGNLREVEKGGSRRNVAAPIRRTVEIE